MKPETTCDDNNLSRETSPRNEDVSVDGCRACRLFHRTVLEIETMIDKIEKRDREPLMK